MFVQLLANRPKSFLNYEEADRQLQSPLAGLTQDILRVFLNTISKYETVCRLGRTCKRLYSLSKESSKKRFDISLLTMITENGNHSTCSRNIILHTLDKCLLKGMYNSDTILYVGRNNTYKKVFHYFIRSEDKSPNLSFPDDMYRHFVYEEVIFLHEFRNAQKNPNRQERIKRFAFLFHFLLYFDPKLGNKKYFNPFIVNSSDALAELYLGLALIKKDIPIENYFEELKRIVVSVCDFDLKIDLYCLMIDMQPRDQKKFLFNAALNYLVSRHSLHIIHTVKLLDKASFNHQKIDDLSLFKIERILQKEISFSSIDPKQAVRHFECLSHYMPAKLQTRFRYTYFHALVKKIVSNPSHEMLKLVFKDHLIPSFALKAQLETKFCQADLQLLRTALPTFKLNPEGLLMGWEKQEADFAERKQLRSKTVENSHINNSRDDSIELIENLLQEGAGQLSFHQAFALFNIIENFYNITYKSYLTKPAIHFYLSTNSSLTKEQIYHLAVKLIKTFSLTFESIEYAFETNVCGFVHLAVEKCIILWKLLCETQKTHPPIAPLLARLARKSTSFDEQFQEYYLPLIAYEPPGDHFNWLWETGSLAYDHPDYLTNRLRYLPLEIRAKSELKEEDLESYLDLISNPFNLSYFLKFLESISPHWSCLSETKKNALFKKIERLLERNFEISHYDVAPIHFLTNRSNYTISTFVDVFLSGKTPAEIDSFINKLSYRTLWAYFSQAPFDKDNFNSAEIKRTYNSLLPVKSRLFTLAGPEAEDFKMRWNVFERSILDLHLNVTGVC